MRKLCEKYYFFEQNNLQKNKKNAHLQVFFEMNIPVDHIVDFQDNVRHEDADSHLDTLAADIEARGLLHPITVRRVNASGAYEVLAGKRRLAAFRLLGRPEIPAIVVDADDSQGFLISLSENMHRHPMTNKDRCRAIRRCYDECTGNIAQVMAITHLSESTLRRYLEISQLPEEIVDRLDAQGSERITLKEAYDIAHPPSSEQTDQSSAAGAEPEKKQRNPSVKTKPWIFSEDGKPIPIPEALYTAVLAMVSRHQQ